MIANIICENRPLYKVKELLSQYSDGITDDPIQASLFNDDRLARSLSALFNAAKQYVKTQMHKDKNMGQLQLWNK